MKVLAAMSGGVDSAVAAARAVDMGHDVVGVHLALSRSASGKRGCCTPRDAQDAAQAAQAIGIPFYVWDFSEEFQEKVIDNFISEYSAGRTPNPCLRCNEHIKFSSLLRRALALGFDAVCTGHYARVFLDEDGTYQLHRASSWAKDQSYVLAVLQQAQLKHCYFPLGATPSKKLVRQEADERGLKVSKKPDSHDVCFIPSSNTGAWLSQRIGRRDGDIIDDLGQRVGSHTGAFAYTVGQRKGLRLSSPAWDGKPRYVLDIEPISNTVVVGPRESLRVDELSGAFTTTGWCFTSRPIECSVQVRAHSDPVSAIAFIRDDVLVVRPDEPVFAVAKGQSAAIYRGTRVLGQLMIDNTKKYASS
ncbi:tRNA 2-thiouridine(34) synthase MnmA [Tropheryma whipplei]|uniref:tRNA-specific 2-thiouridylase MnmA n=1 Tax=Tropheryma whipplei (strain Twist) TaxID=203267 RepID=MNMA_TROWT|nr:tRNA 2-thiouridine(34) synthase MnmA [Tropheryma whipplei]Q820Y1.1 RecName: Full=tRNA-specific 2-thiouridylase MnmA [Tropheryma whipplei str. Twist]AAO44512.1 tRNA (5-methylaminomethyl-2-thiouridylate)-methyltransferase [Tropheryma whipplei str. Twist]MCO8182323.1 tRNA 2-thiouridine(34) synthase MnmA [Tropheryma whipplei]